MSFRQFIIESKSIIGFAKRDIEHLQTVGITPAMIEELETMIANLDNQLSYVVLAANKKIITAQRDLARIEVLDYTKILRQQLSLVFAKGTKAYDSLFGQRLTGISFAKFMQLIKNIQEVLIQNAEKVRNAGVSAVQLVTYDGLVNNMLALHEKGISTEKAFANDTEERSNARKEAYDLVTYVAKLASAYWQRKSPATASNYIIRKKRTSTPQSGDVQGDS